MLSKAEMTMLLWLSDEMADYAFYKSSICKSLQDKGMVKILYAASTKKYYVQVTEAGRAEREGPSENFRGP